MRFVPRRMVGTVLAAFSSVDRKIRWRPTYCTVYVIESYMFRRRGRRLYILTQIPREALFSNLVWKNCWRYGKRSVPFAILNTYWCTTYNIWRDIGCISETYMPKWQINDFIAWTYLNILTLATSSSRKPSTWQKTKHKINQVQAAPTKKQHF